MTNRHFSKKIAILFMSMFLLFASVCTITASADDAELLKSLPGSWTADIGIDETSPEAMEGPTQAILILNENGSMVLHCSNSDGSYAYSYEGTWLSELITTYSEEYGLNDHLTLLFTSTDNPAYAGSEYHVECVYAIYSEAWVENDTQHTYLILQEITETGASPLDGVTREEGSAALHREQGPNMKVVNCKKNVSLRESRSTKSTCLLKVPLGAKVLAFPEAGDENGFIWCVYHDEYGYILAEYLKPLE